MVQPSKSPIACSCRWSPSAAPSSISTGWTSRPSVSVAPPGTAFVVVSSGMAWPEKRSDGPWAAQRPRGIVAERHRTARRRSMRLLETRPGTSGSVCHHARHLQAVDDELHGDRAQHEAHQAGEDAHPRLPQPALEHRRRREREERDERGEGDGEVEGRRRFPVLRAQGEHHHRGDGAGPRQHRDAERQDADVLLRGALGLLGGGLALAAAPRLHHVEGIEADEHAAGDLERADGDAEQLEDEAAAQREQRERDRACPRPAAREYAPHRGAVPLGHGEKTGDDREGIDDEEDGCEDEQQLLVPHIATFTAWSFPLLFASYMARSALCSTSSGPTAASVHETMPMLAVTDGLPWNASRRLLASRPAAASATSEAVSGISTANSSPPMRPTMSAWRTAPRIASATRRSTALPV